MNREDIIRMAEEAGAIHYWHLSTLERFAALVAAAEREACEALHQHEAVLAPVGNSAWGEAYQEGWAAGAEAYRDAIRARGQA